MRGTSVGLRSLSPDLSPNPNPYPHLLSIALDLIERTQVHVLDRRYSVGVGLGGLLRAVRLRTTLYYVIAPYSLTAQDSILRVMVDLPR